MDPRHQSSRSRAKGKLTTEQFLANHSEMLRKQIERSGALRDLAELLLPADDDGGATDTRDYARLEDQPQHVQDEVRALLSREPFASAIEEERRPPEAPRPGPQPPSATAAAFAIAALAPSLAGISRAAADLIRLVALDLQPVAGADAIELRAPEIAALKRRVERQSARALEEYRLTDTERNNYERIGVVTRALEVAIVTGGVRHDRAGNDTGIAAAICFARRNIPKLTTKRFGDEALGKLLRSLAVPKLAAAERFGALAPLLKALGAVVNHLPDRNSGRQLV